MTFPIDTKLRYKGDPIEDTSPTARVVAHRFLPTVGEWLYDLKWSNSGIETSTHTATFVERNMEEIS